MKKRPLLFILALFLLNPSGYSQTSDNYGQTLNVGLGIGYYGLGGHSGPALNINYEFDLHRNFTLVPFIGFYSYSDYVYWGDPNYPFRNYAYRETFIPAGVKLAYYFDKVLHAPPGWNFYAALSGGFVFRFVYWAGDYYGDKSMPYSPGPLYLNLHAGARYGLTSQWGVFLDLSTGVSSIGMSYHFNGANTASERGLHK